MTNSDFLWLMGFFEVTCLGVSVDLGDWITHDVVSDIIAYRLATPASSTTPPSP